MAPPTTLLDPARTPTLPDRPGTAEESHPLHRGRAPLLDLTDTVALPSRTGTTPQPHPPHPGRTRPLDLTDTIALPSRTARPAAAPTDPPGAAPGPDDAVPALLGGTWPDAAGADGRGPRIVAAVRELPDDEPVLVEAAAVSRRLHGALVLLHAVPLSFAERSVGLDGALERGRRVLDEATARILAAGAAPPRTYLVRMWPHELVGEQLEADLLVIGGPRPRPPRRLGLVAGSALAHAPCPVLLVPRRP
jgi:nucleotide-binding universal stress UspA family protein